MTNGMNFTPPRRYTLPKLNLGEPDCKSIPIDAMRIPRRVRTTPFVGLDTTSHPILVIATRRRIVISAGPKWRPASASAGPKKAKISIPMVPPIQEARFAVKSACPGLFLTVAIG